MDSLPHLNAQIHRRGDQLVIDYEVLGGSKPILIFNRLEHVSWPEAADDEKVYRFVVGSSVRLLLGIAPLPWDQMVAVRNIPLVTKLAPHRLLKESVVIPVPLNEYSCYSSKSELEPEATQTSSDVTLFVDYMDDADPELVPSRIYPDAFTITSHVAQDQVRRLQASSVPIQVPVRRVTAPFSRLMLAGEVQPNDSPGHSPPPRE